MMTRKRKRKLIARKLLRRALACFRRARCCIISISSRRNVVSGSIGSGLPSPWGFIEKNLNHSTERPNGFSTAGHRQTKARRLHPAHGGFFRAAHAGQCAAEAGRGFLAGGAGILDLPAPDTDLRCASHLVLAGLRFSGSAENLAGGDDWPGRFRPMDRASAVPWFCAAAHWFRSRSFRGPPGVVLGNGRLPFPAPRRRGCPGRGNFLARLSFALPDQRKIH